MLLPSSYHPSYLLAHSHTGNRAGDCKADDKVWTKIFSEPEPSVPAYSSGHRRGQPALVPRRSRKGTILVMYHTNNYQIQRLY